MTSADFCISGLLSLANLPKKKTKQIHRSPTVRPYPFHSISPPHLLKYVPSSCGALFCIVNSPTYLSLYMRFLFVGAEFCLQLPSDLISRLRPCLQLALLATKRAVDFHHLGIGHAWHTTKKASKICWLLVRAAGLVPLRSMIQPPLLTKEKPHQKI